MENLYSVIRYRYLLLLICMSILTGCATHPGHPTAVVPVDVDMSFVVESRLAFRHDNDAMSGRLIWRHSTHQDTIDIFSVFRHQLFAIERQGSHYQLSRGKEILISTTEVDQLTNDYFGYPIPLSQLSRWVLGIPVNDKISNREPLPYRVITSEGWILQYDEFSEVQNRAVPQRMSFSNEKMTIRFVVDSWILGEPQ